MRKHYSAAFKAQLVLELLKEEALTQLAAEHQVHPNQLRNWRDAVTGNLATLFEKDVKISELTARHEREREQLFAEIGKLTTQLAWLKKNAAQLIKRSERLKLIDRTSAAELSVSTQANLLGIARSSIYYKPQPPSAAEIDIKHRLDELYTEYPFCGSRRADRRFESRRFSGESETNPTVFARNGFGGDLSASEKVALRWRRFGASNLSVFIE